MRNQKDFHYLCINCWIKKLIFDKIENLKRKYRMSEEEKIQKIPEGLEDYDCLSEFDPGKFGEIEMKTYEVETIGDVELTDNEKKILQLHPKFSVLGKLEEDGLDFDQELANAKLRMTL